MDLEYDKKFEEMKKYIPFLDSMIKRLRSTSSALGNPRQAQLDKILSLRDLLSNKKKRMKMENLLKCEQVLINLYAKVEQKDNRETLSKAKQVSEADSSFSIESPTQKEKSDLEAVRNKLKTVTKIKDEPPETLPAILTRNEVEEECTPGSKEPALFQRRPNRSPQRHSPKKPDKEAKSLSPSSCSRKSYTRVLVSPEKTSRNWSPPSKSNSGTEKPLFSRRSPRKSPRRLSPSYYKRERKKSNKESLARKAKDLNITLNVPEDCLSSLNNIDLLPRIMNCSEDDVDIDTLRKLRKQILGELKNTGTRDDISDLLLKSFKKKSKKTEKKSSDVEEGELSDSESETIESVYKSMIVKEQNLPNQSKASGEIRISFVINPKDTIQSQSQLQNQTNDCDLEMYNNSPIENVLTSQSRNDRNDSEENVSESNKTIMKPTPVENPVNNLNLTEDVTIPAFASPDSNHAEGQNLVHSESKTNLEQTIKPSQVASKTLDEPSTSKTPAQFKANFYNPITENIISDLGMSTVKCTNDNNDGNPENSNTIKSCDIENKLEEMNKSTEIPLLNEPTVANPPDKSVVSEIDILQALKNEILGEAISLPSQEVNTPLLHQPKVVKVASAQEILPKKRISIEKYKQKAVNELKSPKDDDSNKQSHVKNSLIMKSSLKLTEKECERFKIPQISFDEDSYDDDDSIDTTEVYNDLAPTSPDQDHDSNNIQLAPPVIIPVDPIKNNTVNHMADVDMRTLPMLSPNTTPILVNNPIMPVPSNNATVDKFDQNKVNRSLDPRVRRDINLKPCTQSPSPHTSNQDKTPIPLFTCLTPSPASNPAMTPNARTYEMTPSHQTFEMEPSNQKHVYVPSFSSMVDSRDRDNSISRDRGRTSRWDNESRSRMDESNEGFRNTCQKDSNRLNDSYSTDMFNKGPRNDGYGLEKRKDYNISECPNTPVPSFGRSDGTSMINPSCNRRPEGSLTPIHPFGRLDGSTTPSHSFGRSECPPTPSHSFGRSECPPTPSHSFGRSECPPTPSHSFGRSECPPTPSHSFGRSDCPLTPSHPFGRLDCPPTPSHSFGRPDGSQTPNHPFGRTESTGNVFGRTDYNTQKFIKDPRLNRKTDSNSRYDDKDRNNSGNSQRSYSGSDSYRNYDRDQSNPRNTKFRYFAPDKGVRHSNRDNSRRELSVGPSSDVHFVSDHSRQRSKTDASARELSLGPSSDRQYISEQDGRQHHRNYSRRESSLGPSSECSQNRERGRYNDTSYEEVGSRREAYNDRRGRNISKGLPSERINNTLSVEPQTGCSFRIDTSVNTTFQNFLEDKGMVVFNHGFDARRQRAGSVGRALLREPSFERTPPQNFKLKMDVHNKRDSYRRAASVGRDLAGTKSDNKSFQEIKADFKSCRFPVKDYSKNDTGKHKNFEVKDKNTVEPYGRSRKEIHESKSDRHRERFSNLSYSPRKNYRDPRMRKEYYKNKNVDGNRQKTAGIVYSNDNIVKGAILSTGSGVKNYKIPKIKRLVEEMPPKLTEKVAFNDKKNEKEKGKIKVTKTKEHFLDKEKTSDKGMLKKNTNNKEKMKTKMISKDFSESDKKNVTIQPILQTSDIAQSDDTIEVRQTRSRVKKTSESVADIVFQTRKSKKAVISDSDSEPESDTKNMDSKDLKLDPKSPVKQKKIDDTKIATALNNNPEEHESVSELDTNFALDDLELFTDNAADAVTDNIDDLIADLDKDLHASKIESSNKFTKEINLENMLQNLTSPHDNKKATTEEISHTDMELNSVSLEDNQLLNTDSLDNISEKSSNSIQTKSVQEPMKDDLVAISQEERKENYDNMVSTSENNKQIKPDKDKIKLDEPNLDCISTPDSTLNVNAELNKPAVNDGIADSTGEVLGETNVSSTQSAESIATVSSLLSLLKDKSKIKELLNMLGDQPGDNEKVKKKLEKLEEIISDVDDDDETKNEKKEIESKSKDDQSLKSTDQAGKPSVDDSLGTINPTTINNTNITTDNLIKAEDIDGKPITNDKTSKPDINKTENIINDEKKSRQEEENLNKTDEDELKPQSFVNESENTKSKNEIDSKVKITEQTRKVTAKITRRTKKLKRKLPKKITSLAEKRVTRAAAAVKLKPKPKTRKKTELLKLQEDIKEMFIRDDVLSSTGIRMCRLAKMIDDKSPQKENFKSDNKPVVILEKHDFDKTAEITPEKPPKKKPGPKPKQKALVATSPPDVCKSGKPQQYIKYKPGPKSKTRNKKEVDPYVFETDSVEDTHTEEASDDDPDRSSDSENGSLASSKSFGSNELLVDIKTKKTKRKRKTWQIGVIPKNKKKKIENKAPEFAPKTTPEAKEQTLPQSEAFVPDTNCFTDKAYSFRKNVSNYSCRLCMFTGQGIVHHYKQNHPHVEIPISRIAVPAANVAIEQCTDLNFPVFRKVPSDKYVCIFCYKEFVKNQAALETFFWHIVSVHTGEYKHLCSECDNTNRCPHALDIPPPPKNDDGQVIGYICQTCHFTQLSLENLKTHVALRHDDVHTMVSTINLAAMSNDSFKTFLQRAYNAGHTAILRSTLDHQNKTEVKSDVHLQATIQSKITFEADDNLSKHLNMADVPLTATAIKLEQIENYTDVTTETQESTTPSVNEVDIPTGLECEQSGHSTEPVPEKETFKKSDDIVNYPHFKINITESGAKEYICCINKQDNHFKTTLLISMKKHVQCKHSEKWDGYCYVCKVIVMPQGKHVFKDCLQHYLEKHMDCFPVLEKTARVVPERVVQSTDLVQKVESQTSKSYLNVRPLSQLISKAMDIASQKDTNNFPVIQSVMSLGNPSVDPPQHSPTYPKIQEKQPAEHVFKYETVQAEVMSNKHRVVLETMMCSDRLIKIYKCAGRFCSFTSDSAEEALLHASTHQRIGGIDALRCSYCDFDPAGNAIDLVMHVFKYHGKCQYSCGKCFYRAAASQSVGAHMSRVHNLNPSDCVVLRSTNVTSTTAAEFVMLTRDQAVPYYVCSHVSEVSEPCKFRTYTPDKFGEHLQQKHSKATSHPCYLCSNDAASAAELIQHMKTHGLKLYQCTWCVHGADNEADLLAHVSTVHPSEQPQAYLRIITNKDGSSERRVLPLAFLNKLKVPTEDVMPRAAVEDPVREAERSIELEKLIGQLIIEPMVTAPPEPPVAEPPVDVFETEVPIVESVVAPIEPDVPIVTVTPVTQPSVTPSPSGSRPASIDRLVDQLALPHVPPPLPRVPPATTPPPSQERLQDVTITPVKKEPTEIRSDAPNAEIVVLDSDDEDPTPGKPPAKDANVIDLSDDDAVPPKDPYEYIKVPLELVHKCPRCRIVCKNVNGLKRHMFHCYPKQGLEPVNLPCPHCKYIAANKDKLCSHYINDHRDRNAYVCGICKITERSMALVKRHVKMVHREKNVVVSSIVTKDVCRYVVNAAPHVKIAPKRKPSATATTEPPAQSSPEKRRYTPQEMDQLPMTAVSGHEMFCALCEFSSKVRWNMLRHLQLHLDHEPVPQTAPVNPVPHLENNEMHFDRMVNLASSSLSGKAERRAEPPPAPAPSLMAPEAAARYPRFVPARTRFTCGAIGCSYLSLDEAMLERHWETLHSQSKSFHCAHCPPNQTLDTNKALTASRILSHLKMHDATLYACSSCSYYHFRIEAVEKHIGEIHKTGRTLLVRDVAAPSALPTPGPGAASMDLKAWHCGLCQFKSMLRPDVVDHCTRYHQSKMQFRCGHCPYRASAVDNIKNHLAHSHANQPQEIIHYYYKEGSLPEPDGVPRWVKQKQIIGVTDPEVKTETEPSPPSSPAPLSVPPAVDPPPVAVDLNLVKKEVEELTTSSEESMEDLCKRFGVYCDPNGIKFKCPLCSVVCEDTKEEMQSHLYEELKYRKWGCSLCTYKAFHRAGLLEHMTSEHRRHGNLLADQIELQPTDYSIEKWVAGLIDHQSALIEKVKADFAKQKIITERNTTSQVTEPTPTVEIVESYSIKGLIAAFGEFGARNGKMYCCPKCNTDLNDEASMRDHLEMELNKIRWCCSKCPNTFQTYHEAQFHCKIHDGSARPKEAIRQPAMRAAWISHVLESQKKTLVKTISEPPTPERSLESDNSLLVVRYEEEVTTPVLPSTSVQRKRSREDSDDESDDPDYGRKKKKNGSAKVCHICGQVATQSYNLKLHILKQHFNLKPFLCGYCKFDGHRPTVMNHLASCHPNLPSLIKPTPIPDASKAIPLPLTQNPTAPGNSEPPRPDPQKLICLVCSKSFSDLDANSHKHDNIKPDFAKKGDVVYKCCICLTLRLDVQSLQDHHNESHPQIPFNYALFKMHYDSRQVHTCAHCNKKFKYLKDLKAHDSAVHPNEVKSERLYLSSSVVEDQVRRKDGQTPQTGRKTCAKKSTTKLPFSKSIAKKSTTKLPFNDPCEDSDEEYSYYNQKPVSIAEYYDVRTMMTFCNMAVPFTVGRLSEVVNIQPRVFLEDIQLKSFKKLQ